MSSPGLNRVSKGVERSSEEGNFEGNITDGKETDERGGNIEIHLEAWKDEEGCGGQQLKNKGLKR